MNYTHAYTASDSARFYFSQGSQYVTILALACCSYTKWQEELPCCHFKKGSAMPSLCKTFNISTELSSSTRCRPTSRSHPYLGGFRVVHRRRTNATARAWRLTKKPQKMHQANTNRVGAVLQTCSNFSRRIHVEKKRTILPHRRRE